MILSKLRVGMKVKAPTGLGTYVVGQVVLKYKLRVVVEVKTRSGLRRIHCYPRELKPCR